MKNFKSIYTKFRLFSKSWIESNKFALNRIDEKLCYEKMIELSVTPDMCDFFLNEAFSLEVRLLNSTDFDFLFIVLNLC